MAISAAMNIWVHISFQTRVLSGYMPRSGIAGPYGNRTYSFLGDPRTVGHSVCTMLHPHQQSRQVPFSPLQNWFVDFLMMAVLTAVRWFFTAVLICISRITSEVEHLFMSLLAICVPSLEKYILRSSACFWIEFFVCCWVVWTVCIFWKLSSCVDHLQKFSPIPFLKI